jgi:hypothetical protein
MRRLTGNLASAQIPKEGTGFDLATSEAAYGGPTSRLMNPKTIAVLRQMNRPPGAASCDGADEQ